MKDCNKAYIYDGKKIRLTVVYIVQYSVSFLNIILF